MSRSYSVYKAALCGGAASLFALTGCVSTQATMLDPTSRPEVASEQVRVYRSETSIQCEYAEVAIINAQGGSNYTNEAQMFNAAKKRAGKIGANGVVIGNINEPSSGAKVAGAIFGVSPTRRGEMLAVYVYEPCRPLDRAGSAQPDSAGSMGVN